MADRLFSSFGQDILDALYWTATEPKERKRDSIGVIPHFIMAVIYVCILLGQIHSRNMGVHVLVVNYADLNLGVFSVSNFLPLTDKLLAC